MSRPLFRLFDSPFIGNTKSTMNKPSQQQRSPTFVIL